MKGARLRHFLPCLFLIASWLCGATFADAEPLTTGAEFEFFAQSMSAPGKATIDDGERGFRERFKAAVIAKCPECVVEEAPGKFGGEPEYKVILSNGWWFRITIDPAVVEIQTKPSTLAEWREVSGEVNYYVFETARSLGLQTVTSGHFNFGLRTAFGDSGAHFLAFFVDYANHPELASGVLGRDSMNAPTLAQGLPKQRTALQKIIDEVYAEKLPGLFDVTRAILSRVYTHTSGFSTGPGSARHYQAFSIKYAGSNFKYGDNPPGELRATRAQRSAQDFILLAELMEARIEYLKQGRVPLLYLGKSTEYFSDFELVDRFYAYVAESGLSWDRYRGLLPDHLQRVSPSDFVTGKFTLENPSDLETLKTYAADVLTSPFLRERFEHAVTRPEAMASGLGPQAVLGMIRANMQLDSPQARPALQGVVRKILATDAWKKLANTDPATLKLVHQNLLPPETLVMRMKRLLVAGALTCKLLLTEPAP